MNWEKIIKKTQDGDKEAFLFGEEGKIKASSEIDEKIEPDEIKKILFRVQKEAK